MKTIKMVIDKNGIKTTMKLFPLLLVKIKVYIEKIKIWWLGKKADKLFQFLYGAKKEVPAMIKRLAPAALLGNLLGRG